MNGYISCMCRNVYETPWDALCVPGSFGHRGASHEVAGRTAGHGSEGPDKEQRGIHSTVRPAAVPEIEPEGGRQTRSASLHVSFDGPRQEAGPRPELPLTCRWRGCVPSRGGTCSLMEENPSSTALTSILQTGGGAPPPLPLYWYQPTGRPCWRKIFRLFYKRPIPAEGGLFMRTGTAL